MTRKAIFRRALLVPILGILAVLGITSPAHATYQERTTVLNSSSSSHAIKVYTDAWPNGYTLQPGERRAFGWKRQSAGGDGLLVQTKAPAYKVREAVSTVGTWSDCRLNFQSTGYRPRADWEGVMIRTFERADCPTRNAL